jgi:hypothetical protein
MAVSDMLAVISIHAGQCMSLLKKATASREKRYLYGGEGFAHTPIYIPFPLVDFSQCIQCNVE